MMHRRRFVGLSLATGVAAVFGRSRAQETADLEQAPAGYPASKLHQVYPLEFRLDSDYRPDLSNRAAKRLVRAVLEFLSAEHPRGLAMTFWNLHPSRMPYLPRHMELVIEHLFRGIADNANVRPVDPILVLALLYNESRFHPKVVSPAGAAGIAQFMPETAKEYGLEPTARFDLWLAYRETRSSYRDERAKRIRAYRKRHGGIGYSADRAVDRALSTGSLDVLEHYRDLRDEVDPSDEARSTYVETLEKAFGEHEFFWDGREALEAMDARISYKAVERAVGYLARALDANQGLVSSSVASYNAGFAAVRVRDRRSILYRFGDLPTYPETVRYVQRFLAVYSAIKFRLYEMEEAD